jgi:hypothetical protein
MNLRELQKAQKEFSNYLKTVPGVQSITIANKGTLCLCVHHTQELTSVGKRHIATELGDIPLMFELKR